MLDLAQEKDIDVLRQAAMVLERENRRLTKKLLELMQQLRAAQGKDEVWLQQRLAEVEQQLAATQKKLYGASSERRPDGDKAAEPEGPKPPPKVG